MAEIMTLGPLLGSPEAADRLADRLGDVTGGTVVVDCTGLHYGSNVFAERLVVRLAKEMGVAQVEIVHAPDYFWDHVARAAEKVGVSDRVREGSPGLLVRP